MRTGFQKHDHNWSQTFRGVKQAANYKRLLPTMVGVLINETWTRHKTKSISPIQATLAQRVVYNLQKHSVSSTVWQKYAKVIIHRMVQKMLRKTVRSHRFWHPQNGTHQRRCVPSGTASQGAECMVNPLLPERRAFSRPLARMAWTQQRIRLVYRSPCGAPRWGWTPEKIKWNQGHPGYWPPKCKNEIRGVQPHMLRKEKIISIISHPTEGFAKIKSRGSRNKIKKVPSQHPKCSRNKTEGFKVSICVCEIIWNLNKIYQILNPNISKPSF